MNDDKLGPMPDPVIEPAEENPGGADAINEDAPFSGGQPAVLGHDLHPDDNPGTEDTVPDEISAPEDKQQENEGDGASEPEKEDPV